MTTLTVTAQRVHGQDGDSGTTVLRVAGDIDLASAGAVREQVQLAVAEGSRRVVLDLSAVRFCDSSGVGVLIGARRLLRSCDGDLRLVLPDARDGGGCAEVHRVFNALGVRRLFAIHADLASATAVGSAAVTAPVTAPGSAPGAAAATGARTLSTAQ